MTNCMSDNSTITKPFPKCVEPLATKGRDEKLEVWTLTLDRFALKSQPRFAGYYFTRCFRTTLTILPIFYLMTVVLFFLTCA